VTDALGREGAVYDGFLPGPRPIDAYGSGGFRFADMSHRGSILALPSGIHAWAVRSPDEIDEAALERVFAERAAIDLLLVGTGASLVLLREALRWRLRDLGLRAEVMQTGAAARTYNILLGERRRVAAALLAVE
jgi:uncharacterized protein